MATNRNKASARESLTFLFIIGGVLVLLNILASLFSVGRLDLTSKRLFSLAEGSKSVAASLEDRMEIIAYFTKDLPPPFNSTARHVRDLLEEYEAASKGNVVVRFISPDDDESQSAARGDGVQPVNHQNIEKDQVSVVEGYRGLVLKYLGEKKTIPVIQDTTGLEYTITTAMKELTGAKKSIGVLKGHNSLTLSQGLSRLASSLPLYNLEEVAADGPIDPNLAALLIIGAESELSEGELRNIDQYVMAGGSLGIFGGAYKVNLAGPQPSAEPIESGLNKLLETWGLSLEQKLVADPLCSRAPMQSAFGAVLVPYPLIPVVQLDEEQLEHPVMFRLASPIMPFVNALKPMQAPPNVKLSVLARSSEEAWTMSGPSIDIQPRDPRRWVPGNERDAFVLMAAIEGELPSSFASMESNESSQSPLRYQSVEKSVRVLVSGTSTFLRDEFLPQPSRSGQMKLNAAVSLALNAIDWLAADSDLIAIRAKTVEDPALNIPDAVLAADTEARSAAEKGDAEGVKDALEERKVAVASWDTKKSAYRWANTAGIPIVFAVFGLLHWRRRKKQQLNIKL